MGVFPVVWLCGVMYFYVTKHTHHGHYIDSTIPGGRDIIRHPSECICKKEAEAAAVKRYKPSKLGKLLSVPYKN